MDMSTTDLMYASIYAAIFCVNLFLIYLLYVLVPWDRLTGWLIRVYIFLFVKVSKRAKCPACGSRRKHEIAFSSAHKLETSTVPGVIIHRCIECKAVFAEPTLVDPGKWLIKEPVAPAQPTDGRPQQPSFAGASREPVQATNVMRDQTMPNVIK